VAARSRGFLFLVNRERRTIEKRALVMPEEGINSAKAVATAVSSSDDPGYILTVAQ